jgi:hypothetical protein
METVTIPQIEEQLRRLPPDRLAVVLDFVKYLVERQHDSDTGQMMLIAEGVLRREWDRPEEDEAWGHL